MASSTTAPAPTATTANVAASSTLPTSPSQAFPSAAPEGFLRPGSPRKRRRSPESGLLLDKTLEGQIKAKLDITSPVELTGASEMAEKMADKKRKLGHTAENSQPGMGKLQSANPRQQALSTLRGTDARAMSKPTDAPRSAAASNDLSGTGSAQVSPVSNASFGTAVSASVNPPPQVASPADMGENDMAEDEDPASGLVGASHNMPAPSSKAYSYPDPSFSTLRPPQQVHRDMSLPGASTSDDAKVPASGKKHKCPYCDTEFTRHHNLKSHLLTHSQEKPFLCQQCDMRFRRLHDLKRHTKLHTGERPHVCPICNRKFARGDALARHTKGSGGCAGHRSSISSNFAGDAANEGEMVMEGMICGETPSQEPGEMDDSEGPSRQLTQLKGVQFQGSGRTQQSRASSTYPQVARGAFPPSGGYGGGNLSPAGPHAAAASYNQPAGSQNSFPLANSNNFGPGGMSESPAPISPSAAHHSGTHDLRRGSVNQQLHPYTQTNRQGYTSPRAGSSGSAPTATMGGLPPPQSVSSGVPASVSSGHFATLLAPISTERGGILGAHGSGHNVNGPPYQSTPGSASTHNSLSSHGQSSGERNTLGIDERDRIWALVSTLQAEMKEIRDRHDILAREVEVLRRAQKEE